jgi:integrase
LTTEKRKKGELGKEIIAFLEKNPKIAEWLTEFSNANTKVQYVTRIMRYFEDTKTTAKDLEDHAAKEIKHLILQYIAEEKKKGIANNSILGVICAVRSFCAGIDKPLKFRKGQLPNLETDNDSHVFTNGDLKHIFEVGDTFEKALISSAVSLGWEVSQFLEIKRKTINDLIAHAKQNEEKFIFHEDTRDKTGAKRFYVLNPLAITWLEKYEETRKDDSDLLFPITKDGVQKLLNRLAETSGLKTTGALRFHNIRKWLMSRLSRANFNEFQIKYIIGHAIPIQDSTYLQTLKEEIQDKYPKVYNEFLNISPEGLVIQDGDSKKLIEALKQRIEGLEKERDSYKAQIEMRLNKIEGAMIDFRQKNGA